MCESVVKQASLHPGLHQGDILSLSLSFTDQVFLVQSNRRSRRHQRLDDGSVFVEYSKVKGGHPSLQAVQEYIPETTPCILQQREIECIIFIYSLRRWSGIKKEQIISQHRQAFI